MKTLTILFSYLMISFPAEAQDITSRYFHYDTLNINNINIGFNNQGTTYGGGIWNIENEIFQRTIVFDQAPWIIAKRNDQILIAGSMWFTGFSPGPIINNQAALLSKPEDSLRYKVYKISRGDDYDYFGWPNDLGAPSVNNHPRLFGDQTLWTVYNYLDSTLFYPFYPFVNIVPFEIEIHQTSYARTGDNSNYKNLLKDVIFNEWEIIYKGSIPIDSAYFGFWCDIDFSPELDNITAVDTNIQTGYCWTNSSSPIYGGGIPVSVGYTLLYGPTIPELGDTAFFKGREKINYKNLPLTAFRGIGETALPSDDSLYRPIHSLSSAWNFARGLNTNGNPYLNPITNEFTSFPFSGNPVTNEGWLADASYMGGESGFMFFSGPFNLAKNDTQWVMVALVPGLGTSNLNSIEVMKNNIIQLRDIPYDSLTIFEKDTSTILSYIPNKFTLFQNYPNPFNPSTVISYELPVNAHISLSVYDILGREIATLVNEDKPAGNYEVEFDASSVSSGIYFYELRTETFSSTKKMILLK